jgi:hypothetical protein
LNRIRYAPQLLSPDSNFIPVMGYENGGTQAFGKVFPKTGLRQIQP